MAAIWPLVPAWRVDRTFDYLVPEKLTGTVEPGSLVRIPFGRRTVRGIVAGVSERSELSEGDSGPALQDIRSVVLVRGEGRT